MSLQLVLYPQSYNGQFSATSTPSFTEYVGNYTFYTSGIATHSKGTSQPWNEFQATVTPSSSWIGWYDNGSVYAGAPAPEISSGRLRLKSASSISWSGVQQKITGLTAGASYDISFEVNTNNTGNLYFGDGGTQFTDSFGTVYYQLIQLQAYSNITAGVHTFTVTAPTSTAIVDIVYNNDDGTNLDINYFSIKENISSAPTTTVFSDGQVICDLYSDESIPLKLSIDEFKNVAEKAQSFSNPFSLPSTKRNNKIFSHLFDTQISVKEDVYAFNPYKKTKAILKEDGYTLFEGFLKLIDINNKDGEASYNVNLYSNTVTLKDTLKDKKLSDLNNGFNELTHAYNYTNIDLSQDGTGVTYISSATTGFRTADTVKYPLCDWNGNINLPASNNPSIPKLEDGYRPWLKMKYIIDRIFSEADTSFTSTFLNSTNFTKLYMDFSGETTAEVKNAQAVRGTDPSGAFNDVISATLTSTSFSNLQFHSSNINSNFISFGYDISNHRFEGQVDNTQMSIEYTSKIFHTGNLGAGAYEQRWKKTEASTGAITFFDVSSYTGYNNYVLTYSGVLYITLNDGDYLEYQHRQISGSGNFAQTDHINETFSLKMIVQTGNVTITSDSYFQSERGKLKQWDLIKGLINMFNLVILKDKDNPTNFIIEPYKDIFVDNSDIITHDWTSKVDINDINLKPIELKKQLFFNYEEDKEDYAKNIYNSATGDKYGDAEINASDFTLLIGETKISAKPYAATYIKPLFDLTPEIICPAMFKGNEDGSFEGYKNKPRICFDNGEKTMINQTLTIQSQNGVAGTNATKYLQFSHLTTIPSVSNTTKDYNFGTSQLINVIGDTPINNLFQEYWAPYYDELYNSDTKTVTLKVFLTPAEISSFAFYDKVIIKNRDYRVNKIEYKAGELSKVEFILIG